jgi:hybrid cluster-associated redox disulfide protein
MSIITKNMKIEAVIKKHSETVEVFEKFGIHCIGCIAASFESIEQGAKAHGINPEELIEELNKVVEKSK